MVMVVGINGGPSGDLYIRVNVQPHETFERMAIIYTLELPLTSVKRPLSYDRCSNFAWYGRIEVPAGTQTGTKFKMNGKGIHNSTTGRVGSQLLLLRW